MSGHSKWATTHRQKEIVDAKRGAIFTKLANIITIAAKRGGDLNTNPSLRTAVEKARSASMPKDNIERAIKKGTGELGGDQIEELYYEAIGPGNSQFVIKCVTDNKNRSAGNVRHIFSKNGGAFGNVLWNFEQKGVIMIENSELDARKINFDDLELELIDAGVDDIFAAAFKAVGQFDLIAFDVEQVAVKNSLGGKFGFGQIRRFHLRQKYRQTNPGKANTRNRHAVVA